MTHVPAATIPCAPVDAVTSGLMLPPLNLAAVLGFLSSQQCPSCAGPARTVEFDFDMGADTAMSVASEMVEDLSLSHDDAKAIAAAIKQEIKQLTGQAPMFSVVHGSASLLQLTLSGILHVSLFSAGIQMCCFLLIHRCAELSDHLSDCSTISAASVHIDTCLTHISPALPWGCIYSVMLIQLTIYQHCRCKIPWL